MSNRQKVFGKANAPHNSKSRARSGAHHLTGSTAAPKLSKLSPSQFVESDYWRGASEKRSNMAVVATFDGISIRILYGDQSLNGASLPPCFFATQAPGNAVIEIATLAVLDNTLPPSVLQKVLTWARPRQAALASEWAKADQSLPVGIIL